MAKSKSTKESKKAQPIVAEVVTRVKNAGVSKPKDAPAAKKVVKEEKKESKKKDLKKKKAEPESSEESDSESASSASDSESSDSESDEKPVAKKETKKAAANGKAKKEESSDSESDSEEESGSDSEEAAKKPATNGKAKAESESDSDSDSDSDSESEEKPKAKVNGAAAKKTESSDSDSDSDESDSDEKKPAAKDAESSDDSEDDSDDSSSEEESEDTEKKEAAPAPKKRKADEEIDATSKKPKPSNPNAASTLFIGSLAWGVDDDKLHKAFESFEGLTSARVVTDKNSGRSRGFGYVDFTDSDCAAKAFEAMQGKEVEGRALNLDFANTRPDDSNPQARAADRAKKHGDSLSSESDTLFVGNLPFGIDQDTVKEFFEQIRPVASIRLPTDPESGELKGFGYVSFSSVEDAKAALEAKAGATITAGHNSRSLRLDYAGAKPARDGGSGGGRGGFGGRGGGGRGGGRGRGGPRGGGRGGRGGFSSANRTTFSGTKVSFD